MQRSGGRAGDGEPPAGIVRRAAQVRLIRRAAPSLLRARVGAHRAELLRLLLLLLLVVVVDLRHQPHELRDHRLARDRLAVGLRRAGDVAQ